MDTNCRRHLKCIKNEKYILPCRVENIVEKGEIACFKQFLLFSQCFLQLYIYLWCIKMWHCVVMGVISGCYLTRYCPRINTYPGEAS